MQPPCNPPWPRLPPALPASALLTSALLLAALALAPHARAADGFTEIGIDDPDPLPRAVRPSLLADEDPIPPASADDAEWAAWWREWRGWTPFGAQEPDSPPAGGAEPARLGGATMPQPASLPFAFADAAPLFIAGMPARGTGTTITPSTTTFSTGPATEEEETITLIEVAPESLLAEPPPVVPAVPVIGEPASMVLLGGALAALGLLRRRGRAAPPG